MSRYSTVLVEGESMQPTYQPGDWLMAKWGEFALKVPKPSILEFIGAVLGSRVGIGDVVVIERPEQPGIFYIKRITELKLETNQIFVSSDNPAGTDSRQWGLLPVQSVRAKVTSRVRKAR